MQMKKPRDIPHRPRRKTFVAVLAATLIIVAAAQAFKMLPAQAETGDPPAPPTGLSASGVSGDSVTLNWDDPGDSSITGHRVLRRFRDGDVYEDGLGAAEFVAIIDDTGSSATTYTDTSVALRTRYVYRVKAINSAGTSGQSNYVNVETPDAPTSPSPPAAPTGLAVQSATHDSVTLSWDDPGDSSITGHQVLRRFRDGDVYEDGLGAAEFSVIEEDTGSAAVTHTDSSVTAGTRYAYSVKAINSAGTSGQSGHLDVETPEAPAERPLSPARGSRPNVVLILADDMGWGDIQSNNPDSAMTTPRIDGIAAAGANFTDAHSPSSNCTGTRYGLLTGRYPWRSWMGPGVLNGYDRPLIGPDRPTLGTLLQSHGYRTAAVGKWHLGMDFAGLSDVDEVNEINRGIDFAAEILDGPVNHGFDEFFGTTANLTWRVPVYIRNNSFTALPHGVTWPTTGNIEANEVLDRLTEEAVSFIERAEANDEPFFLYLPLNAPHVPLAPNDHFDGLTGLGAYSDFVAQVDWTVGQVLAALERVGVHDDTLVIFTSDNGSFKQGIPIPNHDGGVHRPSGGWSAGKGSLREGGHRIPFLLQWPAVIQAGSTVDATVSLTDLYATLAEIVGEEPAPGEALDSVSLLPILLANADTRGVPVVHYSTGGKFAIRDGRWKLLLTDSLKLFDLEQDPGEDENVAGAYPAVVERLKDRLAGIRSTEDGMLSGDATLRSLRLAGIDLGPFDADVRTYTTTVGRELATVEVIAIPTETDARTGISTPEGRLLYGKPLRGRVEVELADTTTTIRVRVTSPDGSTTAKYTVTVGRRLAITGTPQVGQTLTADTSGIDDPDGLTNVAFSYQWVRRDGSTDSDIAGATNSTYTLTTEDQGKTIRVRVSFTDDEGNNETLTSPATATVRHTAGELVWEGELTAGQDTGIIPVMSGYSSVGDPGGTLFPDTFAVDGTTYRVQFLVHAGGGIWLGMTGKLPVDFTMNVGDSRYRGSESKLPFTISQGSYWWASAPPDWLADGPVPVSLTVRPDVPLGDRQKAPVAGYFRDIPPEHSGDEDFSFRIHFTELVDTTAEALRDHVMAVTGGKVSSVGAADDHGRAWAVSVTPESADAVTIEIEAGLDCELSGAICTADGRQLFNRMELDVAGPPPAADGPEPDGQNNPATGAPTIGGTVQVGETLTTDTSEIADEDGLNNAAFSYQWLADDAEIQDATDSTYVLDPDDEGKTIKVRVSFTDDAGNEETLTSAAAAVAAAPPSNTPATGAPTISGTAQVGETLTADTTGISDADGLDNADFDYQWLADDTAISGAISSTYTLVAADEGRAIKVEVSFTDDGGNDESVTSAATAQQGTCSGGGYDPMPVEVDVTAVPIEVESTTDEYFVLYVVHDVDGTTVEFPVQVTLGEEGTTTLAENVAALPSERYRVEKYLIADPADVDGDCIDDISELADPIGQSPVNPAAAIEFSAGAVSIPDRETFTEFSIQGADPDFLLGDRPSPHGLEYMKFVIFDLDTARPGIYFMNSTTQRSHGGFFNSVGLEWNRVIRGEIVYHADLSTTYGGQGTYYYRLQRSRFHRYPFHLMDRVYTLLAANMPLLDDNLAIHVRNREIPSSQHVLPLYRDSRIRLVFDDDILLDTTFQALNPGEAYGLLRVRDPDERPHPHDIVIYETLPNNLPRVAGIISTNPQTPLSHVNLRAVEDGLPNAFIRDVLDDTDIDSLIGGYVHYTVTTDGWTLRAAAPADVEAHYASYRPSQEQVPERDLSVTSITPLSEIGFDDWKAFGVKAANVAVLRGMSFQYPAGSPDGFAVPFYFYDEFMKANGFYDDIREMLADPDFQSDFNSQEGELKKLRKKIKKGDMPEWIEAALVEMHATFPQGRSLRYRSSTNNEDLPAFNGAGLYDSKTQHPEETEEDGISKSLKQVYASLWNFRAFTQREFHRVDHLATAMGVLVHPNYSNELVNGVAVTFDPVYGEDGMLYVNSQLGEDLVTNPDAFSVPEEILLGERGRIEVLATSNLLPPGEMLLSSLYRGLLRNSLDKINAKFAELYTPEPGEPFAMEIEFKITSDHLLSIKQARPWVFSAAMSPSDNTFATGQPIINGTAQVGEILTSDVSRITDEDGLDNATFNYQWVSNDGTTDTDITGAVSSTYTVSEDVVGRTLRVRVSFTDDAGYSETLVSQRTDPVQAGPNHVATGLPAISGEFQVGETLTADVSGISDSDGLINATFNYQWIASDGPADTDIQGATALTYTLSDADVGKTIRVRVSFTDDEGNNETITSAAVHVQPATLLSGAFDSATLPSEHDGSNAFTFEIHFSEEPVLGFEAVRDHVLDVTSGDVTSVRRTTQGSNIRWEITVQPDGNDEVTLLLPFTDNCDDEGAVCTASGKKLLVGAAVFVRGPAASQEQTVANTAATGTPAITGTAQVDETLTADTSGIADADGLTSAEFNHQWVANDGTTDSEIPGETDATYVVQPGDAGKMIRVRVTFTDDAGNEESLTSAATAAVAATFPGTPRSLQVQTGGTGELAVTWQPPESNGGSDVTGYQVQWKLATGSWDTEADVSSATATGTSHTITSLALDTEYAVRVIATNSAGDGPPSAERTETARARTSEQQDSTPNTAATGAPTISGTVEVDETLSAHTSDIRDADGLANVSFSYQWLADDTPIGAATGSTYALVDADEGKVIKVRVYFNDDNSNEESLTSEATASVEPTPNTPATGAPAITGTAEVGETLTADTSGIADENGLDNVVFTYQWVRNDGTSSADIGGATASTYDVHNDNAGRNLRVRVFFTDDEAFEESLSSEAVAVPVPDPLTGAFDGGTVPASHDGSTAFILEFLFNKEPVLGFEAVQEHVLDVTNGDVSSVRRTTQGSDLRWEITVQPEGDDGATVVLPRTTNCDAQGAVCTRHGQMLSNKSSTTINGPEPAQEEPAQDEPVPEESQETTVPPAPTGLTGTINDDGTITISWTAPEDDSVTGYQVLRRRPEWEETELEVYVDDTGNTQTSYTDTNTVEDTRYVYRVKAWNSAGLSEWSNFVAVDE